MRLAAAAALLAWMAALPAAAQLAPETAVLPPERPPLEARAGDDAGTDAGRDHDEAADAAAEVAAPDEPVADEPAADSEPEPPAVEEQVLPPPEPPMPEQLAEAELDLGICLGRLGTFGTGYERGRAISEEGGACGIANPLRVTEIVPGVALSPPGIMRCETAAALAEWVARFALPASAMLPDRGRLVEVTHGSAYVCRNVNNAVEGFLSEHAYGNAIDIMAFRFASGPPIPVEPREREGTPAEAFQRTVRAAACLSFATVLGPGQPAHDDHLHLDVKARDGGFRLCQ